MYFFIYFQRAQHNVPQWISSRFSYRWPAWDNTNKTRWVYTKLHKLGFTWCQNEWRNAH